MTSHDQLQSEEINVESISHLSDEEQAEAKAQQFSKISNEYSPIDPTKIA